MNADVQCSFTFVSSVNPRHGWWIISVLTDRPGFGLLAGSKPRQVSSQKQRSPWPGVIRVSELMLADSTHN